MPCLSASLGFARLHATETVQAEAEFRKQRPGNVCPLNALGLVRIAFEQGKIPEGLSTLGNAWRVTRWWSKRMRTYYGPVWTIPLLFVFATLYKMPEPP